MPSACTALGMTGVFGALSAIGSDSLATIIEDALFYCSVREYVLDNIIVGPYRDVIASQLARALSVLSMVIVTLWVAVQGFFLLSGQGKQAVIPMLYRTGKLVLVLSLVALLAQHSPVIVETVDDFKNLISLAVSNGEEDLTMLIDANLGVTAMLSGINDSIRAVDAQRDSNPVTTTIGLLGQSGPAMLTATLMMLTELSVTLAIMLSPLFLFFLIFQQTAQLFWSWAKFLLGALFSMATLTVVASIALKATAIYGATVVAAYYTNSGDGLGGMINGFFGGPFDINASSLRVAALGTLMTAIIVSVPPVIMGFFGGAAAFTTGAMVSMGGAGMLAHQLGAGKGAGMGVPALGGSNGPAGLAGPAGANGLPGSSGASADAPTNTYSLPSGVRHGADGASGGAAMPAGSRGIANNPSEGGLNTVQARERELAETKELRLNTTTGVYETPSSKAALADSGSGVGTGGRLPVQGSTAAGSDAGASPPSPPAASVAASPPSSPGGGVSVGAGDVAHHRGTPASPQLASNGARQPVNVPEGTHTKEARNRA